MAVRAPTAMTPVQRVETSVLTVGYYDIGTGPAVVLLHGFPYDIHAYADVAPMLAAAGFRVIVPYLRGCGATRFRDATVPRTAEQAALPSDIIDLVACLDLPQADLGGFACAGRAACTACRGAKSGPSRWRAAPRGWSPPPTAASGGRTSDATWSTVSRPAPGTTFLKSNHEPLPKRC